MASRVPPRVVDFLQARALARHGPNASRLVSARRPRGRVFALALLSAVSGCLAAPLDGGGAGGPTTPSGDPDLALVVDHDHFDLSEHAASANLRLVAHDGLQPEGSPSGAHAVDLNGNMLVVALGAEAGESERGFALYDVSVARAPRAIGKYVDDRATGGDRQVMFSADGKTVFLAAETSRTGDSLVLAIDVSDPARPTLVADAPVPPYGPHTLFAAEVGGTQYVYVISFGLQVWKWDGTAFTLAARYVAASPTQLVKVPDGPSGQQTYLFRDVYGHDAFAWEDPVTKQHLAFVAYAYDGFKIVDLSTPAAPRELSSWVPDGPDSPSYVHTVTVRMFGDRRIAAVGAETFENRNRDVPSPVWILDVTDLARPELLATWTNPAGAGSNDLLLSAHDMRFDEACRSTGSGGGWGSDGTGAGAGSGGGSGGCRTYLWLAHYHAG
ncbi:MAG TPA: hypothetical protein VI997_00420, partial [Candidatus Thermoplasmatota archaeon]|nr:hypothetical protein [Candidatus Thermoplasmatota archaeon]